MHRSESISLKPQTLLEAYANGAFPMADEKGRLGWYTANPRGILPLEQFHVPSTLRQLIRQGRFEVRINTAFEQVMRECMSVRESSWITLPLIEAYVLLHRMGHAHSVECWAQGELVGGLYGVSLGAAFFGESMFHRARDASKVALVHLVERLKERGFELLDTQATTSHLEKFGCVEVPPEKYMEMLHRAIVKPRVFD